MTTVATPIALFPETDDETRIFKSRSTATYHRNETCHTVTDDNHVEITWSDVDRFGWTACGKCKPIDTRQPPEQPARYRPSDGPAPGQDYNEWAQQQNARLAVNVELADRLAATGSTPEARAILNEILVDHCGTVLDESDLEYVLDALTDPVAFAKTKARESGYSAGVAEALQGVANRLGLGALE
jgi:hypothetical protein